MILIFFNKEAIFEEKDLKKICYKEYLEDKEKVPRWFPRLTPAKFEDSNVKSKE